MLARKRGANDLTRFSNENKRTCSGGGRTTESLISGDLCWYRDSNQSVLSELSEEVAFNLSKSVVSIALSDGHTVLFASSGIAIECQRNVTKFLTSANLVRALEDATKCHDNVEIEVRHEGNVVIGLLEEYDLDYEIAVVKVTSVLDVYAILLNHEVKFLPHSKVVAVWRDVSGKLMATSGTLTGSCGYEDSVYLMFSTCKFSEDWQGGAFFDFDGNFLGMNLFWDMERSIFLPRSLIRFEHLRTSLERRVSLELVKAVIRDKERLTGDISLVNTFEEPFGDVYPKGVCIEFGKRVSSNIFRNVAALASFNGETRFFACTGFLIDFDDKCTTILISASLVRYPDGGNKIVDDLRIEVLLPKKQRREGTLQHYSLHYNVALVSVKNFRALCPANFEHKWINDSSKLLAVGRCYESGILMAASGELGTLDCRIISYSTCKITMAGIGGPHVDVNGNVVGMNFYDEIGTPFLCSEDILGILEYFKTKKTKYKMFVGWGSIVEDGEGLPNSCPLPTPYWCDRCELEEEHPMAEYERALRASGCPYGYSAGSLVVYK